MVDASITISRGGQRPDVVDRLLRALPDWFGIEESIREYVADAATLPTYLAHVAGTEAVVGVLLLKRHFPAAAEVHLMAVAPELHRRGVGRALLAAAEADLTRDRVQFLQVKTQGPSRPDAGYDATRQFYLAAGFSPLEELHGLWAENPCLLMIKTIAG